MGNNDKDQGNDQGKEEKKAAMKKLRAERKSLIAAASSKMKTQKKDIKAIKEFLKGKELTIPDIAEGISMSKDKTLWYLASLKKYGEIIEGPKDGAFFKYFLKEKLDESKKTQEKAEV